MATVNRTLPDTYIDLIRKFPLVHLADEDQLNQAQGVLDHLLTQELDQGGEAYLEALTDLVETYERHHLVWPDVSPQAVLAELMTTNRVGQQDLADAVGIAQSTISAILTGKRQMTTDHLIKLAGHFHVPPGVFLPG